MRLLITFLFIITFSANAIIIRHDVADQNYRTNISAFPPLATFYIDGAHGTLISPKWIATAAHAAFCIQPGRFVLVNGIPRKIKQLYVHPEYKPGASHDIALVQLQDPVDDVQPAKIYLDQDEQDRNVWFVGIGGTGSGLKGETIDNGANEGALRLAQNQITSAQGALLRFVFDKGDNALPLEGVSGGGDSGGPAFIELDSGFALLGISSRFTGGVVGRYGITEVYSRVSFFGDWITQVLTGNEEQQRAISVATLQYLPGGLTKDILPAVCNDITLSEDTANFIK